MTGRGADRMRRTLPTALVLLGLVLGGVLLGLRPDRPPGVAPAPIALEAALAETPEGFASVEGEWTYRFPADHGAHPAFRSELWYLSGHLEDPVGGRFGFQLSFFRLAVAPAPADRPSTWATNQVYRAQLALTDLAEGSFRAFERYSRAALGLAGSAAEPVRVWLEDWSLEARSGGGLHLKVRSDDIALALDLQPQKPILTPKKVRLPQLGPTSGGFHFYLLPRLSASGTLTRAGGDLAVTGTAWLDRAWGAVPVSRGQVALNRFALQLADGRELLCLYLRRRDGTGTPIPTCVLVREDGSAVGFGRREIDLEPTGHWSSPVDRIRYPVAWRLAIPEEGLEVRISPLLENQELKLSLRLWSGAVLVEGPSGTAGRGYMELTGYAG